MKNLLEKSRYLAIIGVFSLLVAALAAFAWGVLKAANSLQVLIMSLGKSPGIGAEFIEVVDAFLIAATLLIFTMSLYELFIGPLEVPEWMLAHNLYELKAKLSSMIVLVMATNFLEKFLSATQKNMDVILKAGITMALVSLVLIAFGYFGKKD